MRALPLIGSLLVTLVAGARAHAELPRLVVRLAAGAAQALPTARANCTAAAASVQRRGPKLGVTGAALAPAPSSGVAAVNRVEGLASRALQPRMALHSEVVRAVKVTPMWPLGAYVTLEYGIPPRH